MSVCLKVTGSRRWPLRAGIPEGRSFSEVEMTGIEEGLLRLDFVLEEIRDERQRQERLKNESKFLWTCADNLIAVRNPANTTHVPRYITHQDKMTVLAEEVGEAAREVCDAMIALDKSLVHDHSEHVKKLRKELVQVAAVAVAWVESIDKNGAP
jgi:hypothetical protein